MKKLTTNIFIEKAVALHDNTYDYSSVNYVNNKTKIKIICNKHGEFEQIPSSHLCGRGCLKCSGKDKLNENKFIIKANKIHNNKYNYSQIKYVNNCTHIEIICSNHGKFIQTPTAHLMGRGCPICKSSKGELMITNYLIAHNVEYVREMKFDNCKNIFKLSFDFYLPKLNLLVEYDGIQHHKPLKFFGGESAFLKVKMNDKIKNMFAKNNSINLLRIKYNELNNIDNILNNVI